MADYSGSARFQALFESALQAYEKKTGITLAQHPLALSLQTCHSVDDVASLLQCRAHAFDDIRQRDRMMRAIKTIVFILTLTPLSHAASLAHAAGLVRQTALMPCSTSLTFFSAFIPTCKGNTSWSRCITGCKCHSLVHI